MASETSEIENHTSGGYEIEPSTEDVHDGFPGDGRDYVMDYPYEVFEEAFAAARTDGSLGHRGDRPLFLEVYAGKAGMSRAMEAMGFQAISVDLPEWDLRRREDRRKLIDLVKTLQPDVPHHVLCGAPSRI